MISPDPSTGKPARRRGISRRAGLWLGLFVAVVIYPVMVGVVPWALSGLTRRLGWTAGRPGAWNLAGLILVAVGVSGLAWVFGTLLSQVPKLPEWVELEPGERLATATARVLITRGPFAISRNPMFLSGVVTLLGWAAFYGSWPILAFGLIGWWVSNLATVPREERNLEARFGEEYRDYRARVPRWLLVKSKATPGGPAR